MIVGQEKERGKRKKSENKQKKGGKTMASIYLSDIILI